LPAEEPTKSNAILVPTWYSGTSKIIEQVYVGQGRALDPEKYFIIIVNQIGNGLSSSPHNTPPPGGMASFPRVRIGDDVRAQHKLLTDTFGIDSLALVVGGSMGAQQTYEWAVRYPAMVKRAAPIAGTARNTTHDFLFAETLCDAITSDPAWNGGFYAASSDVHRGLARHAKMWAVMGWSTEFYQQGRPAVLGFSSLDDFIVNFMAGYFAPMDPNDLLCMPIGSDMFFPPADCAAEQAMIPGSEFRPIRSIDGHLALFGADPEATAQIDRHLKELLERPA
jgi:homoserine O-acetyltransferase/O-succinyltransferase